jgi:uncharacterized membrane protein (UPF0127 family)
MSATGRLRTRQLLGIWCIAALGAAAAVGCTNPNPTGDGPGSTNGLNTPADEEEGTAADLPASSAQEPADEPPADTPPDTPPDDADQPPAVSVPELPADDLLDDTPNAEHLGTLTLAHVRVGGQLLLVWVADEYAERIRGLMYVTEEELAPLPDGRGRGMLFVWSSDNTTGFWMRNTITALDIAFIRQDGTIITTHTMTPPVESIYPPDGPYRFALEVPAGTFDALGFEVGDLVEFP